MDTFFDRILWVGSGVLLPLVIAGLLYLLHLRRLSRHRKLKNEALFSSSTAAARFQDEQDFFKPSHPKYLVDSTPTRTGHAPSAELALGKQEQAAEPSPAASSKDRGPVTGDTPDFDIHEVDPLVEAEIYMSYGRYEQAENILTNALARHPGRHELSVALLHIYAERKDVAAFEHLALKIHEAAAFGGENEALWEKATQLGRQIDPENPLYGIGKTYQEQDANEETILGENFPVEPLGALEQLPPQEPKPPLRHEPLPPVGESNELEFFFEAIPSERATSEFGFISYPKEEERADFENLGLEDLFPSAENEMKSLGKKNKSA